MGQVRPFRFTGLPRYTFEQVAVSQSLAEYLSAKPLQPEFAKEIEATLKRYLKVECKVAYSDFRALGRGTLGALLPKPACIVVIGAAPLEQKILVDLDMNLAGFAIERLLGGAGDDNRIQRALTEIEHGVLSFVLLKVLSQFQQGWNSGRELALTLDRFASSVEDIAAHHQLGKSVFYVRVQSGVGQQNGLRPNPNSAELGDEIV